MSIYFSAKRYSPKIEFRYVLGNLARGPKDIFIASGISSTCCLFYRMGDFLNTPRKSMRNAASTAWERNPSVAGRGSSNRTPWESRRCASMPRATRIPGILESSSEPLPGQSSVAGSPARPVFAKQTSSLRFSVF